MVTGQQPLHTGQRHFNLFIISQKCARQKMWTIPPLPTPLHLNKQGVHTLLFDIRVIYVILWYRDTEESLLSMRQGHLNDKFYHSYKYSEQHFILIYFWWVIMWSVLGFRLTVKQLPTILGLICLQVVHQFNLIYFSHSQISISLKLYKLEESLEKSYLTNENETTIVLFLNLSLVYNENVITIFVLKLEFNLYIFIVTLCTNNSHIF